MNADVRRTIHEVADGVHAISNTFGPNILKSFKVWTDEV